MPRLTINMPDAMHEFVQSEIASGSYETVSEYFRDLVRHKQARRETAEKELRQMLIAADKSGVSSASIDDIFERVKDRLHREGHDVRA